MSDNVNKLVGQLLDSHQPVTPEHHPLLRVMPLLLGVIAYMACVTLLIGLRADWQAMLSESAIHQIELLLSFIVSVMGMLAAGWLRIPYASSQRLFVGLALSTGALFLGFQLFRLISEGINFATLKALIDCYIDSLLLATLPTIALVMNQRSGSSTHPYLSALMGTFAITGFAWIGLRLTCGYDLAGHNAIAQLSPFMLLGVVMGLFAKRLYRW